MGLLNLAFNAVRLTRLIRCGWQEWSATPEGGQAWDGPDDLWPDQECDELRLATELINSSELTDTASKPELIVTQQWGLRLPSGEVVWNSWQGTSFEHPLDRLRMVAILQKTATDLGFREETEKIHDFLSQYSWATRNQIASVVYEDTGTFPLTASEVSKTNGLDASGTGHPIEHKSSKDDSNDANTAAFSRRDDNGDDDSSRSVRPGSMGGTA